MPAPKSGSAQWHLHSHDGQQYGPVAKSELDIWLAEGLITASCQVRREGDNRWQPATTLYPQLTEEAVRSPAPSAEPTSADSAGDAYDGENFRPERVRPFQQFELSKERKEQVFFRRKNFEPECKRNSAKTLDATGIPFGPDEKQHWLDEMFPQLGQVAIKVNFIACVSATHPEGDFTLVCPSGVQGSLPHEFYSILPGHLPYPLAMKKGKTGFFRVPGKWESPYGDDPLVRAADAVDELWKGAKWGEQSNRGAVTETIVLDWVIQAIPLDAANYVYMVKTLSAGMLTPNYRLDWFLERRRAFCHFLARQPELDGPSNPVFFYPTASIWPLGMTIGAAIADGYGFDE